MAGAGPADAVGGVEVVFLFAVSIFIAHGDEASETTAGGRTAGARAVCAEEVAVENTRVTVLPEQNEGVSVGHEPLLDGGR